MNQLRPKPICLGLGLEGSLPIPAINTPTNLVAALRLRRAHVGSYQSEHEDSLRRHGTYAFSMGPINTSGAHSCLFLAPASVRTVSATSECRQNEKAPIWLAYQQTIPDQGFRAEDEGFEPSVTRSATTAFEAAPFVRSGNLPLTRLAD